MVCHQQIKVRILRAYILSFLQQHTDVNHGLVQPWKKTIWASELKLYSRVLRIPWIRKVKNAGILRELNNGENWITDSIMMEKLKYFVHIKCHWFRKNNEGGHRSRKEVQGPTRAEDFEGILGTRVHESGWLVIRDESFQQAGMRVTFHKSQGDWQSVMSHLSGSWWECQSQGNWQSVVSHLSGPGWEQHSARILLPDYQSHTP